MNRFVVLCLIFGRIALEPTRGINSDEAVAFSRAVQAGVLSAGVDTGELDVKGTMGIETVGGVLTELLPRNIPNKKPQISSTASDNQHSVTIRVNEDERPMTKDNHTFGKNDFRSIRSTAEERGTGNKAKMTIINDQNMFKRTIKHSKKFALKDKKVKNRRIKWRHKFTRRFRIRSRRPFII